MYQRFRPNWLSEKIRAGNSLNSGVPYEVRLVLENRRYIHDWIMNVYNSVMDMHNWIMDIPN